MGVRIYATIDRVFAMLAEELSLSVDDTSASVAFPVPDSYQPLGPEEHVFSVPYDQEGKLLQDGQQRGILDLRDNIEVTLAVGKNKNQRAIVLGRNADGHYRIAIT